MELGKFQQVRNRRSLIRFVERKLDGSWLFLDDAPECLAPWVKTQPEACAGLTK